MDEKEKQIFGVKLTNELMTDIIGAMIPGALFIICIVVCAIIPTYFIMKWNGIQITLPDAGSFWWAMLIICIILSYVFGLIFYRADIKVPDKIDIERQIVGELVNLAEINDENELIERIKEDYDSWINGMNGIDCSECKCRTSLESLKRAYNKIKKNNNLEILDYLRLLFPEDNGLFEKKPHLSYETRAVLNYL